MNLIYLITTSNKIVLDYKLKEILKNDNNYEIVNYDLLEDSIDRVIEDLDTYNFLTNKKIIIASNAYFLSSDKTKSMITQDTTKLEKYIDNPNPLNILILICDNIDKRKKIVSNLLKNVCVINDIDNINSLIKENLEDYKMSDSSINKLIEYCMNDSVRIFKELDKLKAYKIEDKVITDNDINDIVMKSLDDNIFHLADSILSGNKKYAFELYNNFILHGEQVVNIIRILSNKIRLIYQVKVLINDGNSDQEISKLLKVHEYPVKLARQASYNYTERVLLEKLEQLADLDFKIKSGETLGDVEFEMLLATI